MTTTSLNATTNRAIWGAGFMVAAGAAFAVSNNIASYVQMNMGASSTAVAFGQYLIAAACFVPWILSAGRGAISTAHPMQHAIRVLLSVIGVYFWTKGLASVPIWQAVALLMMSPFFVTLGAGLILRERVSAVRWICVLLGIAGGALILQPWSDAFQISALLPVGAAAMWAGVSLMTKRMTQGESAESLTFYLLVLLAPINGVLFVASGVEIPGLLACGLIAVAGIMVAAAQYFIARSYAAADAAFVQPFDHIKLLFNVGIGWMVFAWAPPGNFWLGAAIIIGASSLLFEVERRTK